MTTGLYDYGSQGQINLTTSDIRAIPVTQLYNPKLATHTTLADIPEVARAAEAVVLVNRTTNDDRFDADDLVFPSVVEGLGYPIIAVVLYDHDTEILLGYFDYFYNLPLSPDGRDVLFMWPDDADRIFSW